MKKYYFARHFVIVFLMLLFFCGCGSLKKEQVISEFQARQPAAVVKDVYPGEGDFDSVYYHILFKKPEDSKVYEAIWLYQRYDYKNKKMTKWAVVKRSVREFDKGRGRNE